MAKLRISNQFGKLLQRVDFTGTNYLIEPPLVVAIDGMEAWESNDSGSVTYGIYEQYGQPTPDQVFTLVWEFLPTGERHFTTEKVDAGITITTEETVDETIYYIKAAQNRLHLPARPPRPPHTQRSKQAPPPPPLAALPPPPPPPPVQPPAPSYQAPPQQAAYPPPPVNHPPPVWQPALRPPPPPFQPPPQQPPRQRGSNRPGIIATAISVAALVILACSTAAVFAARAQRTFTSIVVLPTSTPMSIVTMAPTIMPTMTPFSTPTPMDTVTPTPHHAVMVARTSIATITAGKSGSAVATCQSGEQMVGGGFDFYYPLTPGVNLPSDVEASYPPDLTHWTAVVNNMDKASHSLTVYADCVQANFSLGMQLVPTALDTIAHTGGTVIATCPAASVVTGGGASSTPSIIFGGELGVTVPGFINSYPQGNGWQNWFLTDPSTTADFQIQGYALCATQNYRNTGFPPQPLSIAGAIDAGSSATVIVVGSNTVTCPLDQLLTGGGFYDSTVVAHAAYPLYNVDSHPDANNPQGWDYTGENGATQAHDMQIIANCLGY